MKNVSVVCTGYSMRSRLARGILLAIVGIAVLFPGSASAIDIKAEKAKLDNQFKQTDADGDGKISREEYLSRKGDKKVLERDFKLFDFDANGTLSKVEFSITPGSIHPSLRGPVPDPLEHLRLVAIDAMDESMEQWDETPERTYNPQTFVIQYLRSISTDNQLRFDASLQTLADENGDQKVSRDEAIRFIEIQLGIRISPGILIREPSGRIFDNPRFQYHDINKDGAISKQEYLTRVPQETSEQRFKEGDLNGDGIMTIEECANPTWFGYEDLILEFRYMDTDFDGLVSREEMAAKTPDWRTPVIRMAFSRFDDDADGKIRLEEFLLSPAGNRACPWWSLWKDGNRDRKLTFNELTYQSFQNTLLWRFYFSIYDTNADNALTLDEFEFTVVPPNPLHRMKLSGESFDLFYVDENFPSTGSPAVSPDGQWVLFDAFPPAGIRDSRVMLASIDGKTVKNLNSGLMPTWSSDGKRFACSRYQDGSSVWIMDRDGTNETKIDDGWGAQWSPDGRSIAYTQGRVMMVYDVEKKESRVVLKEDAHPYRYLYYNSAWSPDSKKLLFRAYKSSSAVVDIVTINMEGDDPDLKVHLTSERNPDADIAWFPDGKRILVPMLDLDGKVTRRFPYVLNIETDDPPVKLKGIDESLTYNGLTISPDGKWIIMSTAK